MGLMYEEEEAPWEGRDAIRLDCEPHRATLISRLGLASLVFGLASFCLGITGLAGLPMGIATLVMAHRDIAKMRTGHMDRRGEKRTRQGGDMGLYGAVLSFLGAAFHIGMVADRFLPPPYGRGIGW